MGINSTYHLFGVDGGGTGCRAGVCDAAGTLIAQASGGPANFTSDAEGAIRNILAAVQDVAASAAMTPSDIAACTAHVGLAGVMGPADQEAIAKAMPFAHVTVSDDLVTSVTGALEEHDGVLAAIGTGSVIGARKGGVLTGFGGWGHCLGDQASGGWLGHQACRLAMLAHDGVRTPSSLTDAILEQFNNDPVEIVKFAATATPGDFARFAPRVVDTAKAGDTHGQSLMQQGAAYLHACFLAAGFDATDRICLTGGVGPHYGPYLEPEFRDHIQPPSGTALDGALRLARMAMTPRKGSHERC